MELWRNRELAGAWQCCVKRRANLWSYDVLGEGKGTREEAVHQAVAEARASRRARQIARAS